MQMINQTMTSINQNDPFIQSNKNIQDFVTLDRLSNEIPTLK
jgi:hypothetical protein